MTDAPGMTRRAKQAARRVQKQKDRVRHDKAVYAFLAANPKRGHRDIANYVGITVLAAKRALARLLEADRIVQMFDPTPSGNRVGKYYYVVTKGAKHETHHV